MSPNVLTVTTAHVYLPITAAAMSATTEQTVTTVSSCQVVNMALVRGPLNATAQKAGRDHAVPTPFVVRAAIKNMALASTLGSVFANLGGLEKTVPKASQ